MRKFSIATLMSAVLVCAIAAAALRSGSENWASALVFVTVGILAVSLLGALERTGNRRAYWRGFALFGWGYLLLALGPTLGDQTGAKLPTSLALGNLWEQMRPEEPAQVLLLNDVLARVSFAHPQRVRRAVFGYTESFPILQSAQGPPAGSMPLLKRLFAKLRLTTGATLEQFRIIGHCLIALACALVGAAIAHRFHAAEHSPPPTVNRGGS